MRLLAASLTHSFFLFRRNREQAYSEDEGGYESDECGVDEAGWSKVKVARLVATVPKEVGSSVNFRAFFCSLTLHHSSAGYRTCEEDGSSWRQWRHGRR
jgi:hypothetical protein